MQLAITISRVYEGDDGPVLRRLLQETVLPLAAQEGNRWLAAWAFWMLGRKDVAVRALIVRHNSSDTQDVRDPNIDLAHRRPCIHCWKPLALLTSSLGYISRMILHWSFSTHICVIKRYRL